MSFNFSYHTLVQTKYYRVPTVKDLFQATCIWQFYSLLPCWKYEMFPKEIDTRIYCGRGWTFEHLLAIKLNSWRIRGFRVGFEVLIANLPFPSSTGIVAIACPILLGWRISGSSGLRSRTRIHHHLYNRSRWPVLLRHLKSTFLLPAQPQPSICLLPLKKESAAFFARSTKSVMPPSPTIYLTCLPRRACKTEREMQCRNPTRSADLSAFKKLSETEENKKCSLFPQHNYTRTPIIIEITKSSTRIGWWFKERNIRVEPSDRRPTGRSAGTQGGRGRGDRGAAGDYQDKRSGIRQGRRRSEKTL